MLYLEITYVEKMTLSNFPAVHLTVTPPWGPLPVCEGVGGVHAHACVDNYQRRYVWNFPWAGMMESHTVKEGKVKE